MIKRYSSKRDKLSTSFLNEKLKDARNYDRIAGYFCSSILEVAGEAIQEMEGSVRIICNSGLDVKDVATAQLAHSGIRREWCDFKPEELPDSSNRFKRLYYLLKSGKMKVKVIPDKKFGLIHGKAGVITLKDGSKTSFLGSANETYNGWMLNYELIWEDNSVDAVNWVQEEFDSLWNNDYAIDLSDFVIEDIKRISEREVIYSIKDWKLNPEPASTTIESPVYRKENGLWEHQKYFVNLAFESHKNPSGARYILADMVGLGKTVQLALSAKLMALYGEKPILIIAPKTLLWQWQEELNTLIDMPSAVWNGKEWVDENGLKYPNRGEEDIVKCPRKVGIISQGLITSGSKVLPHILNKEYECVIIDEAHRARRRNLGKGKENQKPIPNKLMDFLLVISKKCRSMLLATATPIQLSPIELWDLLFILSQKNDSVLGNRFSNWRANPEKAINLITGAEKLDFFSTENWDWIRNPFPPSFENERTFGILRRNLNLNDDNFVVAPEIIYKMSPPDQKRVGTIIEEEFFSKNNPFIRHVIRRTRDYLEKEINPETGQPYLKRIDVKLLGEKDKDAIEISGYLRQAYELAEEFCKLLKERAPSSGFIKTLLLKRIGSTMISGLNTAKNMLKNWNSAIKIDDSEEEEEWSNEDISESDIKNITPQEEELLFKLIKTLEENQTKDPKYHKVLNLLTSEGWKQRGCIIFSQYYDSAYWVAENLSNDFPSEQIGLYAGGDKSCIFVNGIPYKKSKEELKSMVKKMELKILIGTDSASEGLNLQTLGTLINLDLPWNPTRLEQRKGRIQRIGQIHEEIYIFNMRYKDSVEDRVHKLLSERLESIYKVFGQLPDVLEDVWINIALNENEEAKRKLNEIPTKHPFDDRYQYKIHKVDWESCNRVLDKEEKRKHLMIGW